VKRLWFGVVCGIAVAALLATGTPAHAARLRSSTSTSADRTRHRRTTGADTQVERSFSPHAVQGGSPQVSRPRQVVTSSALRSSAGHPCRHRQAGYAAGETVDAALGVVTGGSGLYEHDAARRGPPRMRNVASQSSALERVTAYTLADAAPNAPPVVPCGNLNRSASHSSSFARVEHLLAAHSGLRTAATGRLIVVRAPSSVGRPRRSVTRERAFRGSVAPLSRRRLYVASRSAVTSTAAFQEVRVCLVD
jgi:hypothetical protein